MSSEKSPVFKHLIERGPLSRKFLLHLKSTRCPTLYKSRTGLNCPLSGVPGASQAEKIKLFDIFSYKTIIFVHLPHFIISRVCEKLFRLNDI